nr:NB-ARC domains-containing protein [Tanacetum cinerariifolium]
GIEDQLSAKHQLAVKGLFECRASKSNIRRIQVKNFVKEVKDYLKTYSSAGMDISCEACDRFKDLLRACPRHGFSELHQLGTFYNALNSKDQDSLNSDDGGNFLDKIPRECLAIIDSKSKVRYSCNKPLVAKELAKILECKQTQNPKHEVRIIFYDVKPDVVRHQTDNYAEAFDKRQRSIDHRSTTGRKLYPREILKKLCDGPLHVGENLVGIDFHFEKLDLSCFVGSNKVHMIGICGISGIGKTALAKSIYDHIYIHFEGSCFCKDVQGVSKQQGLTQVQMQMIGKIIKTKHLKISSVGEGIMVIRKMMTSKLILLILDDVDDHEQLDALASSPTWFCPGSLIIFTSKDK